MAPALLLAQQGASTAEVVEAIPANRRIPPGAMKKLRKKASMASGKADLDKFEKVASMLWAYFLEGASGAKFDKDQLPLDAFDHVSGALITLRLDQFDPDGNHMKTNVCAFMCGHYSGLIAAAENGDVIDKKVYIKGWAQTEEEMSKRLNRLRRLAHKSGRDLQLTTLGNGC